MRALLRAWSAVEVKAAACLTDNVGDVQAQLCRKTLQYLDLPFQVCLVATSCASVDYSAVHFVSPSCACRVGSGRRRVRLVGNIDTLAGVHRDVRSLDGRRVG